MALVAGVDSSTQATKVEIRDADDGTVLGAARVPHPPAAGPCSEQDPTAWWDALDTALQAALATAGAPSGGAGPAAIAVAGQQHGMVVLDRNDDVVRPAKLWNDTESAVDAEWLLGQGPGDAAGWARACGSVPVASFTITKLSWLHRCEPHHFARLARVLLPHDYLTWCLTGRFVTDRGDASGTGYWSPHDDRYRLDLLELVSGTVDWERALPEVLGPRTVAGEYRGAVVAPGTGDNMAAALGLGLRAGEVVVSLGTSGTVFTTASAPTADPTGAVAGFADAGGRFLPLVCTLNATRVTDAVARLLGVDHVGLDALAAQASPGAAGVTLLPYFDGERTPNRPDATGLIGGLRSGTSREQLARAAYEGVVCGLLDGLDALRRAGVAVDDGPLTVVGGGARSQIYPQALADLSGRSVRVLTDDELAATGACVQAAAVLHNRSALDVAGSWRLGRGRVVEPRPVDADTIRTAYAALRDGGLP